MSTITAHAPEQVVTLSIAELESLIRNVVRDEIESALTRLGFDEEPTVIEVGSLLYENMMDIQHRAQEGKLKFYTHEEVWSDEPV